MLKSVAITILLVLCSVFFVGCKYANNPEVYNKLGFIYEQKGQYHLAIRSYRKAISIKPDSYRAYAGLGFTFLENNEYDIAIKNLMKAVEINSKYAKAYTGLGMAYMLKGDQKKAVKNFLKSIEFDSTNYFTYTNLGLAYLRQGDLDNAVKNFRISIFINPECKESLDALDFIERMQNKIREHNNQSDPTLTTEALSG